MTTLKRLRLFLAIVWRDWEGPISISTAWRVTGIVNPRGADPNRRWCNEMKRTPIPRHLLDGIEHHEWPGGDDGKL